MAQSKNEKNENLEEEGLSHGNGKLINTVDIVERGQGQLNVFANDLSTGIYTYSLVADGQIVSTKRMMKQ